MKYIISFFLIVFIFSCNNAKEDNLLKLLRGKKEIFEIGLLERGNKSKAVRYLGSLTNINKKLECVTNKGYSNCKLVEIKQENKEIVLKIISESCIEFINNENDELPPKCKRDEIKTAIFKIDETIIDRIINNENFLEITGEIIDIKYQSSESDNLINELKSIKKDFVIILWKEKVSQIENPVGYITRTSTNEFFAESGIGLASCELLEMKQLNENEIFIKVKVKRCIEITENEDTPPNCIKWEILIIEYKLNNKQIKKIKEPDIDELNITGNIINK